MKNKLFIVIVAKLSFLRAITAKQSAFFSDCFASLYLTNKFRSIPFLFIFLTAILICPPPFNRSKSFNFFTNNLFAETSASNPENLKKAFNNYIELQKTYSRWNSGLLKSEKYYKKFMTKYLAGIQGKEILTGNNYCIITPEGEFKSGNPHRILVESWLQIKGDISEEALSGFFVKENMPVTRWRRSKSLLAIYGKIIDFRLESADSGNIVVLNLENIILKENDNPNDAGKNSK